MKWSRLLILVAALLAGCRASTPAPNTIPTPVPTSAPTSTPGAAQPTVVPTSDAAQPVETPTASELPVVDLPMLPAPAWLRNAQTYRDEVARFELDYPVEWDILDLPLETKQTSMGYSVTLNSWPRGQGGNQSIPEDGAKIDIAVQKTEAQTTEEAVALLREQYRTEEPPVPILSEQEWILRDGTRAIRLEIEGRFARSVVLVTVNNGHLVLLAALGDFERTDEIAGTLRLLE